MRVKGSVATRKRRKKILTLAKGYVGSKHALFRVANEQMLHSLSYAYRDRRNRKRDFRVLWIKRLNAMVRTYGINYSQFIFAMHKANLQINRKILASIAVENPQSFDLVMEVVKKHLKT